MQQMLWKILAPAGDRASCAKNFKHVNFILTFEAAYIQIKLLWPIKVIFITYVQLFIYCTIYIYIDRVTSLDQYIYSAL